MPPTRWCVPGSSIPTPTTTPSSSGIPQATPSNLHGVTSIVAGNCGFTLAPVAADNAGYLVDMMVRVEGMAKAALTEGVPWDWDSFASYLDRLDGNLGVNAAFMVGPLRPAPPGDGARFGGPGGHRRAGRGHAPPAGPGHRGRWPGSVHHPVVHPRRRGRPARAVALGHPRRVAGPVRRGGRSPGHPAGVGHRRMPEGLLGRRGRPDDRDEPARRSSAQLERAGGGLGRARALPGPARGRAPRPSAGGRRWWPSPCPRWWA